mmetsp:Transcript_60448/g.136025  ORF Transcript_60448/g.136025 Transcript_60448/m.136025 type:complete len:245 (+) Transcript_60448:74-808(+)
MARDCEICKAAIREPLPHVLAEEYGVDAELHHRHARRLCGSCAQRHALARGRLGREDRLLRDVPRTTRYWRELDHRALDADHDGHPGGRWGGPSERTRSGDARRGQGRGRRSRSRGGAPRSHVAGPNVGHEDPQARGGAGRQRGAVRQESQEPGEELLDVAGEDQISARRSDRVALGRQPPGDHEHLECSHVELDDPLQQERGRLAEPQLRVRAELFEGWRWLLGEPQRDQDTDTEQRAPGGGS